MIQRSIWVIMLMLAAPVFAVEVKDQPLSPALANFFDGLTWSTDIRVMYDGVWTDTTVNTKDRNRGRIVLKFGLAKIINEQVSASFRLASGVGANPALPLQSFDNVMTGKAIAIDHLFVDAVPLLHFESLPKVFREMHVVAGKQPLPFRSIPSFIWDPDVSPEGISEIFKLAAGQWRFKFVASQFFIEDNAAPDDPYILSHEISIDHIANTKDGITFGLISGIHHAIRPFSIDQNWQSASNYAASAHTEIPGFSMFEISGYASRLFSFGPVTAVGGYTKNLSAKPLIASGDAEDDGWIADLTFGRALAEKSWELGFGGRRLEADAALGQLTDFISTPAGTTDAKAWFIHGAYVPWNQTTLSLTFFSAKSADGIRRADPLQRLETTIRVKF